MAFMVVDCKNSRHVLARRKESLLKNAVPLYHRHRNKKLEWCRNRRTAEQKEKSAAYQREWRHNNKEYVLCLSRIRYERNREEAKQRRREQYAKNKDKIRARYYAKKNQEVPLKKLVRRIEAVPPERRSLSLVPWKVIKPTTHTAPNPPTTSLKELGQELFSNIIEVF